MTTRKAPRVGFFGQLGSGNLGNDGSFDAVLRHLRVAHPDVELTALCGGPEQMASRYGVPARPLYWYRPGGHPTSGPRSVLMKMVGKGIDAIRTVRWVRECDVVVVPGMGVLEASVPLRASAFPWSLFVLAAATRITGRRLALVSVGADDIPQPVTRFLIREAARAATYRSLRDPLSRQALCRMGVDATRDAVFPDLAFGLPAPASRNGETGVVAVGVMAYRGGNGDHRHSESLSAAYTGKMAAFVCWVVENGRIAMLVTGDRADERVADDIRRRVLDKRPDLAPARVVSVAVPTLVELMTVLSSAEVVVATRYHNVLCALKMCVPTVSVGYSAKHDELMARFGMEEFCHPARDIDLERLVEQFKELENRSAALRSSMRARNDEVAGLITAQLTELSDELGRGGVARRRGDLWRCRRGGRGA